MFLLGALPPDGPTPWGLLSPDSLKYKNWKEPFGLVTAQWGDAAGFTVRTTLIPGLN